MAVFRIFVEKKPAYAVEAASVLADVKTALQMDGIEAIRVINRYDVEGISEETFRGAIGGIFSEVTVDNVYEELSPGEGEQIFAVEPLPGQFDQRADSCAQCIQLATQQERPTVRTAKVYLVRGHLDAAQMERLQHYLINPVECRLASLEKPQTLEMNYPSPDAVETLTGFTSLSEQELFAMVEQYGLAMDEGDLAFCQTYFRDTERRDPTITELRLIDTYWSDHCRHTTFSTQIDKVEIQHPAAQKTWEKYLALRETLYAGREKPVTLMDLATIGAKALKAKGLLKDLDESEEINACSVKIKVDVDGREEDWLLMFKNETHNHPTEIEPFGGAATCLGGAIRDPLSGRSYVYQAMRVTGAADPLVKVSDTIPGKLPQRKIVTAAAAGYSSYGNQIGLATGLVEEIYHPGYLAKRMEVGAVIAAAPADHVIRQRPQDGDVVILLGGRTGRDGCGGATGSSKSHTVESLEHCGAEVQKGNPPEERKIQRLFRNPEATRLIKRCNDFGAGGVSVAIGELADGLEIQLDRVPKKYEGLDGTELAISESQERMAVVVAAADAERFQQLAHAENLESTIVAKVTESPRLVMHWKGKVIVDLSREFLSSNGAKKFTDVTVEAPKAPQPEEAPATHRERMRRLVGDLNICSQKGLVERFDSTIGAGSVFMPFGGRYQLTPVQAMVAKLPVLEGETSTCSIMAYGFNPYLSSQDPYLGAMLAVVESVAKVVAAGGSAKRCWLSFQEYFERLGHDPHRWGKPMSALLGALEAQMALGIGAIGGKDSMSGSFEQIDVPPTLISFAVSTGRTDRVVSPEFEGAGNRVYLMAPRYHEDGTPDFESVATNFSRMERLIGTGLVRSAWAVTKGGMAEGLFKMCIGNRLGFELDSSFAEDLYTPVYGAFLVECTGAVEGVPLVGRTTEDYTLTLGGEKLDLAALQSIYQGKLAPVYPDFIPTPEEEVREYAFLSIQRARPATRVAKPRVLLPVFPGTNCEYDTARAFQQAGAETTVFVIRNLTAADIEESISAFVREIQRSQIIALPGGFSGGDEPDGSGKFITAFLRNPRISLAVNELLKSRDGLMLGICNGFQALIKLGLVPFGEIVDITPDCPTLTFNTIGRHQSMLVRTRVASNQSPWLMHTQVGEVHTIPISHGEGRFIASPEWVASLAAAGQIATQYVDLEGHPSMDIRFNPNQSIQAIEGITSPDGRVLGKMGHSERIGSRLYQNVLGRYDQKLFAGAVDYFSK